MVGGGGVYMKNKSGLHFMIGIFFSFTIEILVMTLSVVMTGGDEVPVSLIGQAFALAVSCALIGVVCCTDRLSFLLQAVFTYIFALATVLLFSLMFHWNNMGEGILKGNSFFVVLFVLFTLSYSVTMSITWVYQKKKKKLMNDKLAEYKETVEPAKAGGGELE